MPTFDEKEILAIERPKDALFSYYMIQSLGGLILAPFLATYYYFRFHTMRYKFDAEGISMRWGILFHYEIVLNYARIQDIHLRSNFIERMLGLMRIEVQTASAGASAEMVLEGMEHPEQVRDFLYSKMRGADHKPAAAAAPDAPVAEILLAVASEMRAIREALAARQKP